MNEIGKTFEETPNNARAKSIRGLDQSTPMQVTLVLQTSLGSIPLHLGSTLIAGFEVFVSLVGIPSLIFSPEDQKNDESFKALFGLALGIICTVLNLAVAVLLLAGVLMQRPWMLIPWLAKVVLVLVLLLISILIILLKLTKYIILLIPVLLWGALWVYLGLVVLSYYLEMRES